MSVSVSRQSSYSARSMSSARSISSASVMNQIGGMQLMGSGQTRMSSGQTSMSSGLFGAHSVQGGAGGFGTRISQSVFSSGSMGSYGETSVISNGKVTMQNLNDRLASYLQKVHTLESANRKLELQIREYLDKRMPTVSKDFTVFFANISDLRVQILKRYLENQSISLQADNARLAAEDFKMKYEAELNMRNLVEADVARLRGVRDSFTLSISDLEVHVENLKGELVYFKSNHEEEMRQLRIQQSGTVNVEVDSAASVDLTKVLEEVRLQYEALVLKNNLELEKWFKAKMEIIEREIYTCTTEVKTFSTELSELRRTYQSLEISRQSILKENLQEVKSRFSIQLSQLQMSINMLETELQQLRVSLEQQQAEYNVLLDIKMRLEMEIAEYRRLLEGEHKPHIERRVKTIEEVIIDGKVVSTNVDTTLEDVK
uniref:Keratin 99 n=1 Tax=Labrus bergylta TaxID=56723 RepID=A0A3Q3EZU0_9LABR